MTLHFYFSILVYIYKFQTCYFITLEKINVNQNIWWHNYRTLGNL